MGGVDLFWNDPICELDVIQENLYKILNDLFYYKCHGICSDRN